MSKTLEELKKLRDELIEKISNGVIPDKLGKSRLSDIRERIRKQEEIEGISGLEI